VRQCRRYICFERFHFFATSMATKFFVLDIGLVSIIVIVSPFLTLKHGGTCALILVLRFSYLSNLGMKCCLVNCMVAVLWKTSFTTSPVKILPRSLENP